MYKHHTTVLGAGSWGTALALLIARNGHNVYLWARDPEQVQQMSALQANPKYLSDIPFPPQLKPVADLSLAVSKTRDIFLAIPSQAFRETLIRLKGYLSSEQRLIIATKGLDPISGDFLTETVLSVLGYPIEMAVLSGPTFAGEIAICQPSAVTLASLSNPLIEEGITLLHNSYFRIYRSHDVKGVQVGGVVKNVLAIATGIAEGLGLGANTQSALITRGLAEMVRLGLALGCHLETFLGLAGVGDLVLTATSNQSRNRRFGVLVGQGLELKQAEAQVHQVVEGVHNARQVYQLAEKYEIDMPITSAVFQVLEKQISPKEAVEQLLARPPKTE